MSVRCAICVASMSTLLVSVATAEELENAGNSGVRFPTCSQSMIVGPKWQAVFDGGASTYGISFSCPISISSNGALTPGNCTMSNALGNVTVTQAPSGTLIIDRACHVTGSITYTTTFQNNINSYQMLVSLSRSIDGSRLAGFSQTCSSGICNANEFFIYPFEMNATQ
jgi:hypothetical protein